MLPGLLTLKGLLMSLVLLCGARADSKTTGCLDQRSTIAATTVTETSTREDSKAYQIATYGEEVSLFCSGDTKNLTLESDGKCLTTTMLNSTTIGLSITPCVGQYEYYCVDEMNCRDTLIVIVVPSFSVRSKRVRYMKQANGRDTYFVPRGDVYEMVCSGRDLYIYDDLSSKLKSETVNLTSVRIEAQADTTGIKFYSCTSRGCTGVGKMKELRLIVDFYPEAINFQCTSFGLHWRKLECSWTSSSKENKFKLFLVTSNGRRHLLCSYGSGAIKRVCWADNDEGSGSLLLETCNEVFCVNNTYPYETNSIVKLDPPSELQLLNRTSHGATLKWYSRFAWWESEYRVEYRLLGSTWKQINTSTLKVPKHSDYCEFQVTLPCPDAHYEVRVSVKHREAIGERLWSEPSPSLFFFTEPDVGEQNPACDAALQEPEPITSVQTGLNEVGKLIRQSIKEKLVVKSLINDLKLKLAKIRALREL